MGLCLSVGPTLIVTGVSIQITKTYRIQLWLGWVMLTLSMGVLTTLHADSSVAQGIGLTILVGVGCGVIYSATYFPVLAPLPISENAHALAFFSFCRAFAAVRPFSSS